MLESCQPDVVLHVGQRGSGVLALYLAITAQKEACRAWSAPTALTGHIESGMTQNSSLGVFLYQLYSRIAELQRRLRK